MASKKQKLQDIHTEALTRFAEVETRERDQRKLAIEDMKFANEEGGQWDDDALAKRKDRPRYTINKVAAAIDQLVGDQRQNRTDIKVRPVSGGASESIAKIYNGLIRNIEAQSKAENAYDAAYDEEVTGGFGGWRVVTEFNDDDVFEQDIKIKPIESAASSLWLDPNAKEYDKRDSTYGFLTTDMSQDAFKDKYPNASVTDFSQDMMSSTLCQSWFRGDVVRVAEYWKKIPVKRNIGKLSDGRVVDLDDEAIVLDELAAQGITVIQERVADSHKVVMYIISGSEVLKGPMEWAGKFIPLIPVYGKMSSIEGKKFVRGLVRFAKDPSRIYNYATSANIEAAALAPKDPYWMTKAQAKGNEVQLSTFNQKNPPFMFYNGDPKAPGPPQRTGAPSVQTALLQQIQQASLDIEATTGLHSAALGNGPQLLSEKSLLSQAEKGDRGAYVFTDNLNKSIQFTGDILVDLIPKIYDTSRMIRVLHIDGTSDEEQINAEELDQFGRVVIDQETQTPVMVNDISVGKYDVVIETGPAFSTQRQESAQQLIELANGNEIFGRVAIDLIAKNLNILENDELTKRVRRLMINEGIVDPTEEEAEEMGLNEPQQPQGPSEQDLALIDNIDSQTALNQASIENKMASTDKLAADTVASQVKAQQETAKTLQILVDIILKKIEAGVPVTEQERNLLIKQRDIVDEGQQLLDPGANSEELDEAERQIAVINQGLPPQ